MNVIKKYNGIREFEPVEQDKIIKAPLCTLKTSQLMWVSHLKHNEVKKAKRFRDADELEEKFLIKDYLNDAVEIFNHVSRVNIPEEIGKALNIIEGKLKRIFKQVHGDKIPFMRIGYLEYEPNAEGFHSSIAVRVDYREAKEYNFEILAHIFENGFIRVGHVKYINK